MVTRQNLYAQDLIKHILLNEINTGVADKLETIWDIVVSYCLQPFNGYVSCIIALSGNIAVLGQSIYRGNALFISKHCFISDLSNEPYAYILNCFRRP